jgi:amino acid transporter
MFTESKRNKTLGVFSLVMINVIAIDSLRNLPSNAATGLHIIFYYIFAGIVFLLPCILITAELATNRPKTGGAYIWVRDAFGAKYGFLTIWLQWIYNVIWYPTILSFIAVNIAYLFDPKLIHNNAYMIPMLIAMFTLSTIANNFGMKLSSLVSTLSAIIGTIIPMVVIIILGIAWIDSTRPLAIEPTFANFIPTTLNGSNVAFLVVVFFSLMGFEMSSVHAEEVKNPKRDFPRALAYSSLIVMVTMILASAAIAIVVPEKSLNIVSGLDQAFGLFLNSFHLKWLLPIVIIFMVIGGFGGMSAWVIGPSKGLMVAAQDNCAPAIFGRANKRGAPSSMLWAQWGIVIVLCILFAFFKSFNTWYWILSDLSAQFALLFYILVFAASIKLRYITEKKPDTYRIPGGKFGIWFIGLLGIAACIFAIIIGLIPPSNMHITYVGWYEVVLIGGCIVLSSIPLFIYKLKN